MRVRLLMSSSKHWPVPDVRKVTLFQRNHASGICKGLEEGRGGNIEDSTLIVQAIGRLKSAGIKESSLLRKREMLV
jgi:hypothetical protein